MTDAEDTGDYLIYIGYGAVMRQLQVLELGLWGLLCRRIKPGTSPDQAFDMVEKWDSTTFGQLMRGMKNQEHWPEELLDKLLEAVKIRNYLAHHFLREYFMVAPSRENVEAASHQLADLSAWLENLDVELESHLESLGIATTLSLDDENQALADSLRPRQWFGFVESGVAHIIGQDLA